MTSTVYPDTEGALRTALRTVFSRVEFAVPSSAEACITLSETGSTFDTDTPVEHPLIAFSCWASYDPTTKKPGTKQQARQLRDQLIGWLADLGTAGRVDIPVDGVAVRLLSAVVINSQWLPDLTTKPATPRYVVDAVVHAIAVP